MEKGVRLVLVLGLRPGLELENNRLCKGLNFQRFNDLMQLQYSYSAGLSVVVAANYNNIVSRVLSWECARQSLSGS